jgi:Fe-S-cluster containining protein
MILGLSDAITRYYEFRQRVDRRSGRLVDLHCKHIACRPGCHDCCTDLSVSAVEYHAILREMRRAGVKELPFDRDAACPYLQGGLCGLYRFRPLICRTHGLPVAFLDEGEDGEDAGQGPGMSVSFCPKNFTEASDEDLDFGPDNTLDLDALNVELAEINRQFEAESPPAAGGGRRIPLRQLRDDLLR